MEASGSGRDQTFEVDGSPESAAGEEGTEGTNVARVAALSTLLGGAPGVARELAEPLHRLGFSDRLLEGETAWRTGSWSPHAFDRPLLEQQETASMRVDAWARFNEEPSPEAAMTFVAAALTSRLERESAAAAAVLWRNLAPRAWRYRREVPFGWHPGYDFDFDFDSDFFVEDWGWWSAGFDDASKTSLDWDPDAWADLCSNRSVVWPGMASAVRVVEFVWLAGVRLRRAFRSPDPVTRSYARAAFLPRPDDADDAGAVATVPLPAPAPAPAGGPGEVVSTIVHGTFGWKGRWWRPRGDFHEYVRKVHRKDLYAGGARYSWSGAYSGKQRALAAEELRDWAMDRSPGGLNTVFGHSYGGEVAARAILLGQPVAELVLLSVPATRHVNGAVKTGVPVVDIRLAFDIVLGIAWTAQRLASATNVVEHTLDGWWWKHGATHESSTWISEKLAI